MFKTAITEMFGVKYPIICGAMMWLSKPKLCAAISKAGGLGNLTAGNYTTEAEFRSAINEIRTITDNPFMANVTILPSVRLSAENYKMYIKVIAEEQVAGVEISGAPLDKGIGMEAIETLKKAGVKMFHKVGSVRHAVHAEKVGYDGIYAAGLEEGGHPLNDDVTTMLLTPLIADTVKIPVVTVGGIADGRSVAAAITLGASGVMMASRFIATRECDVHDNIRKELVARKENDTIIFGKQTGLQGRALKNKVISEIISIEDRGGDFFEEIVPLMAGERVKLAWEEGNVDIAPLMVGQSIGLIKDLPSCQELLDQIAIDATATLSRVNKMIV